MNHGTIIAFRVFDDERILLGVEACFGVAVVAVGTLLHFEQKLDDFVFTVFGHQARTPRIRLRIFSVGFKTLVGLEGSLHGLRVFVL